MKFCLLDILLALKEFLLSIRLFLQHFTADFVGQKRGWKMAAPFRIFKDGAMEGRNRTRETLYTRVF